MRRKKVLAAVKALQARPRADERDEAEALALQAKLAAAKFAEEETRKAGAAKDADWWRNARHALYLDSVQLMPAERAHLDAMRARLDPRPEAERVAEYAARARGVQETFRRAYSPPRPAATIHTPPIESGPLQHVSYTLRAAQERAERTAGATAKDPRQ